MKVTLAYSPENRTKINKQLQIVNDSLRHRKQLITKDPTTKSLTSKTDIAKYYQHLKSTIKTSECLIVELSSSSTELGFLIAEALTQRKPVLALVPKASKIELEGFFNDKHSRFLQIKRYSDATLAQDMDEFVTFAAQKVDTKFILIITPEIDSYLRWKAKEEGVRKAEVVRNAVEEYMVKDKAYKA